MADSVRAVPALAGVETRHRLCEHASQRLDAGAHFFVDFLAGRRVVVRMDVEDVPGHAGCACSIWDVADQHTLVPIYDDHGDGMTVAFLVRTVRCSGHHCNHSFLLWFVGFLAARCRSEDNAGLVIIRQGWIADRA
ncbi:hypothetical protein ACQPZP_04085 [Spirillospora sp. CA-142024]|uniref:hypothetical protein n=1 Tax=Spirillospora sp. CA-142024 TaxID=3240036 RepID=UPI003D8A1364